MRRCPVPDQHCLLYILCRKPVEKNKKKEIIIKKRKMWRMRLDLPSADLGAFLLLCSFEPKRMIWRDGMMTGSGAGR